MASHPHTAARTTWHAAGDTLSGTESRWASGDWPLALARANGNDWPWLETAVHMAWRSCGSLPPVQSATDDRVSGWATAPRIALRTPPPATRSVATARAFTLRTLEKWGLVARSADAAAVVTELLTNALRHALPASTDASAAAPTWPIRLGLADPGPYVICAVADPSTDIPAPRHSAWHDEAGRGLLVVASLSDQWGYCAAPADQGKVVWAAFATAAPSR
jgi:anti-sigma regulatory factor (Ser/Thr protein kinase)